MIKRKWAEKSSKIPIKIAGQNPVGYPAGSSPSARHDQKLPLVADAGGVVGQEGHGEGRELLGHRRHVED